VLPCHNPQSEKLLRIHAKKGQTSGNQEDQVIFLTLPNESMNPRAFVPLGLLEGITQCQQRSGPFADKPDETI
jgi:hypothetical protein